MKSYLVANGTKQPSTAQDGVVLHWPVAESAHFWVTTCYAVHDCEKVKCVVDNVASILCMQATIVARHALPHNPSCCCATKLLHDHTQLPTATARAHPKKESQQQGNKKLGFSGHCAADFGVKLSPCSLLLLLLFVVGVTGVNWSSSLACLFACLFACLLACLRALSLVCLSTPLLLVAW